MDNYTLALEKDRDTRIAELERCRSEVERFVAEVERLMRERDGAQSALLLEQQVREAHREAADDVRRRLEQTERERDEWKARAESAAADNAALRSAFDDAFLAMTHACDTLNDMDAVDADEDSEAMAQCERATAFAETLKTTAHPGAALLARLRATEKVVEAARHVLAPQPTVDVHIEHLRSVNEAIAAYDAAKEGK